MSSAAPSSLRAPLQQSSQSGISRLISRPATPADSNSRRPLTAPNSPRLGGAGSLGGGVRRKSASGARSRETDPSIALQKALSSDEFLRKREGKKRGAEGAGSENTPRNASSSSTSSTVAMSRSRSSSSATSSTGSGSTLQPRHVATHPRASRSHSSLSSRQRSRSRSRTSRGSPILAASPLSTLPPTNRTVSSSSCPEPRGATLSVTPTTSEPVMVDVQAEGELELRGRAGGNAAEVLVELRDGRSVPNSEYGDDDRDHETFGELDATLIHDCTLPLPLSDLPLTDDISASHSLPSMHSSPLSQPHSRRPSASRHRTSPSVIPSPTENTTKLASNVIEKGTRRYSHNSAMSTSPRAASPEPLLTISATRLPSAPASSSTRPRAPTTASQQRGRSPTTSSTVSQHQRTPSQSSRSLVVEKRRRRESVEPAGGEAATPEHIRPPLHTYTSFETAFGVEAPRSPEGSPTKAESKGWWGRS